NTATAPYYFVHWVENGMIRSVSSNYTFGLHKDTALNAVFALPSYQVSVSNSPAVGSVIGAGTYTWGTTNLLSAYPNPGYRFLNWTESGEVIGTNSTLLLVVSAPRSVVANYVEANVFHEVTTGTLPSGLAVIAGSGVYTNGAIGTFSAPLSITNPPNIYTFRRFTLNGGEFGTNAAFTKTFSTLDPTNMHLVAEYQAQSILPLVTNVTANFANPVPLTTNFVLTLQFNRSMQTSAVPTVLFTNETVGVGWELSSGGVWGTNVSSNDVFHTVPVTFGPGMDGTFHVIAGNARDVSGETMATTNLISIVVDATPPATPAISLVSSNATSATIAWSNYVAPSDLSSFRVYVHTNQFSSLQGLTPLTGLNSSARQYQLGGLELDRSYFVALVAVDLAGNSSTNISPLSVLLPSSIPPAVPIHVTSIGSASALVSWTNYNTANLFGFAGFQLFYEETNFHSVAGLSARANLGAAVRSTQVNNLDRTKNYFFAVVGVNGTNGLDPNVTTATWSDPYAGTISVDTAIGGTNQSEVAINQSIVVRSNATLTILPGTTLRFANGTGITIEEGRIVASGTALDPIVMTSSNDQPGGTPSPGDWNGVRLEANATNSILRHVWIKYGSGLRLHGASVSVDSLTALYNSGSGLALSGTAMLSTTNAWLSFNEAGAVQTDTAALRIQNSVIKNNGTNVVANGSASLIATQNWWGTINAGEIAGQNSGPVIASEYLTFEPVLTPAVGTVGNVTQVASRQVNLRFAGRNAESVRVSENSTFAGSFFAPLSSQQTFQLSDGAGQKTIYVQYRSVTGDISVPVSVTVQYITAGPVIQSFNLNEGQQLSRPLTVLGSASATLGLSSMEFHVNDVLQSSGAGSSYSYLWDIRTLASGVHRVKLLARDNAGNIATLERNVIVNANPPPAPLITSPASDMLVSSNQITITGTAEP
ncbi:MAG: Ig-like domain-containing protein, partial [Limisphaerales bacterium]